MNKSSRRKFVKNLGLGTLGFGLLAELPSCRENAPLESSSSFTGLPRNTPEQQGVDSSAILKFLEAVNASDQEFHGFMLLRNGAVISEAWWEPFRSTYLHTLYSLSKSFTSTAVGMLVDDGQIQVSDRVIDFFPEEVPAKISDHLQALQIKHLLTMTTGHAEGTMEAMLNAKDGNWTRAFLAQALSHQPGTFFFYNTGATYMLSAIVQKIADRTVEDLLQERLFNPLNIIGTDWEKTPQGINVGGYGLRLQLSDIATFGQLYLQEGHWNGQQLISKAWVREATSKQVTAQENDSDWGQGYGYQFWQCRPAPGFYRGDGAFGQFCIVIPALQSVIAIHSESKDMQATMNLVWDHLLPALQRAAPTELPPAPPELDRELANKINQLQLPIIKGLSTSPIAARISGRKYQLATNDQQVTQLLLHFRGEQCTVQIERADSMRAIQCAREKWVTNENVSLPTPSILTSPQQPKVFSKVAAYYFWQDERTFVLKLKFVENMHGDTWTFSFDDNMVRVSFLNSIAAMQDSTDERGDWEGSVL